MVGARRIRVSVCALTDLEDLAACVEGGADAVGVLVGVRHRAEDAVSLEAGAKILERVPPYVGRYAITHALTAAEALHIIDSLPIDTLQIHDAMPLNEFAKVRSLAPKTRFIKGISVTSGSDLTTEEWEDLADAVILDSACPSEDRIGGTGQTHDWNLSRMLVARCRIPAILAGGLNPENVAAAVRQVCPWGVNVNSGVETEGRKDRAKVRSFVKGVSA